MTREPGSGDLPTGEPGGDTRPERPIPLRTDDLDREELDALDEYAGDDDFEELEFEPPVVRVRDRERRGGGDDGGRSGPPPSFRPGPRELRVLGIITALAVVAGILLLPPVSILKRISGDGAANAGEGFSTRARSSMPALPAGLEAASVLYDITGSKKDVTGPITMSVRLNKASEDTRAMAFYTYGNDSWTRLASVTPIDSGKSAQGDLVSVPTNIAVLRRASVAHQLGVIVAPGDTLDPSAQDAGIVSVLAGEPSTGDEGLQLSDRLAGTLTNRYLGLTASTTTGAAAINRILNDSSATRRHIDAITAAAAMTQAAGVHIDYLGLDATRRSNFTTFVEQLADRLKKDNRGLVISVPTPQGQAQDAYDWVALQKAANAVWLRAPADPAAYYDQLETGLRSRRENGVDLSKVSLVIDRRSRERAGDVIRAISLRDALTTASALRARVEQGIAPNDAVTLSGSNIDQDAGNSGLRWDERSRSVMFAYAGRAGSQTVWIENRFSIAFRLDLARRYNLGGVVVEGASRDDTLPDAWNTVLSYTNDGALTLETPYGPYLQPSWRASDGQIEPGSSSGSAVWRAPSRVGTYQITLVISDGVTFVGQQLTLPVTADGGKTPTPTPVATSTATVTTSATAPPKTTATPSSTATPKVTATATPVR
ncbi:MAG: hypothetical protein DWI48_04505 [Chloroflexi bacterium]|nr:MAG: hypothetical protein DWI48_04505 [Chloroflexota bacterium]